MLAIDIGSSARAATILLVDDEEPLRKITRRLLVRAGHAVHEASDGTAALAISEEHGAAIDLVVTDITMPQMNGRELAARLRLLRPGIKVLYTSGYLQDVQSAEMDEDTSFLEKPFTPADLERAVQQLLTR